MQFNDTYVAQILREFKQRHAFAKKYIKASEKYEQLLCTSFYNDDADLCFMFNVNNSVLQEIDVYANYGTNLLSGNIYAHNANNVQEIIKALRKVLKVKSVELHDEISDGNIYFSAS